MLVITISQEPMEYDANGEHLTIAICKLNKMVFQRLIKEYNLIV